MGRIDIGAAMEEEFNDWYNTAYIPPYLTVPGCLGARRYVAIDSQPKYLTLYEFANAAVSESPEWDKARDSNPWSEPGPPGDAARCRIARCVSPSVPQITQCFHNNTQSEFRQNCGCDNPVHTNELRHRKNIA